MEIAPLRAELAQVKIERDILGKATASHGTTFGCTSRKVRTEVHLHPSSSPRVADHRAVPGAERGRQRVSRARGAPSQHRTRRHLSDEVLLVLVRADHTQTKRAYGLPRRWRELRKDGVRFGKQRLQMLMRTHGIRAKGKKRSKVTTNSTHDLPIAPNLPNRQFTVAEPDTVLFGDNATSPPTKAGCFRRW